MLFADKNRIEDFVIEVLDQGSRTGPELLQAVLRLRSGVTKQAVYKALRALLTEEVINKTAKTYSLNRYWLQKLNAFAERHIESTENTEIKNIMSFEEGDSVVYRFRSPYLLDVTWGHLYDILYDAHSRERPMLNYHPHEWLILSRPETERYWLDRFNQDKKMILFSVGGNTSLDKKFQQEWSSEYVKINIGKSYSLKENQYLAVMGDYVFEIMTDKKFEQRVDEFFEKNKILDEKAQKQIEAISKMKYRSKLKLTKSKKKADLWRKRYAKDFYIPESYR